MSRLVGYSIGVFSARHGFADKLVLRRLGWRDVLRLCSQMRGALAAVIKAYGRQLAHARSFALRHH